MTRDEQEMALWREAYNASRLITRAGVEAEADAAVEAFRKRYPPQPAGDGDPDTAPILGLLDAITGDSAFTGLSDSLQSRIYAAADALQNGRSAAPPAVWYDTPPRPGEYHVEGLPSVCWVEEDTVWCPSWDRSFDSAVIREMPRNGRRVCPIVKPQEPKT